MHLRTSQVRSRNYLENARALWLAISEAILRCNQLSGNFHHDCAASRERILQVCVAASSQLNRRARARPVRRISALRDSLAATRRIASAMDSALFGSTRSAADPTTSDRDVPLDVMTGVPQAMASAGGRPKPSYKDGYTKIVAPE